MRVRLTRKLAERIDGVDLSKRAVGDVLDLPRRDARLLIAEEWAEPVGRSSERKDSDTLAERILAASAELDHRHLDRRADRRAEDQYREEWRARREKII